MNGCPALIAHRGYARRYPENTIEALAAALEVGATHVEFDVQMTADGVPVVLHDDTLERTGGVARAIGEIDLAALRAIEVNEAARLGGAFRGVRVPTLEEACAFLAGHPDAFAFAELKRESLERTGREVMVERVLADLAPIVDRCAVISFDEASIALARRRGAPAIGWVLDACDRGALARARDLAPEFLFCNHELLPPAPERLADGPWRWAIYEIDDAGHALRLAARGAALIETMAIGELIADPRLAPWPP